MEDLTRLGGFSAVASLLLREAPAVDESCERRLSHGSHQRNLARFLDQQETALHVLALAAANSPRLCARICGVAPAEGFGAAAAAFVAMAAEYEQKQQQSMLRRLAVLATTDGHLPETARRSAFNVLVSCAELVRTREGLPGGLSAGVRAVPASASAPAAALAPAAPDPARAPLSTHAAVKKKHALPASRWEVQVGGPSIWQFFCLKKSVDELRQCK